MVGCNPIRVSAGFLILVLAAAGLSAQNRGPVRSEERVDPPGFGSVHLKANHTIRLNVTCFGHEVGRDPAGPCRGAADDAPAVDGQSNVAVQCFWAEEPQ